jgi:putative CocE/NonD family hydrolase
MNNILKKAGQKEEVKTREGGIWSFTLELLPVPKDMLIERDIYLTMSDGTKIAANIYRPNKAGKFPVVMAITPYGKDGDPIAHGVRTITGALGRDECSIGRLPVSKLAPFEGPDPAYWVSNGYAVVVGDIKLPFLFTEKASHYVREVIDWAGTQEWSNGNVGMSGVSALCMVQYFAAVTHPAHLKAIIPWEGVSDEYRDTGFPGGIPETFFHGTMRGIKLEEAVTNSLIIKWSH